MSHSLNELLSNQLKDSALQDIGLSVSLQQQGQLALAHVNRYNQAQHCKTPADWSVQLLLHEQ